MWPPSSSKTKQSRFFHTEMLLRISSLDFSSHFSPSLIQLGWWREPGLLFAPYLHPKEEEG